MKAFSKQVLLKGHYMQCCLCVPKNIAKTQCKVNTLYLYTQRCDNIACLERLVVSRELLAIGTGAAISLPANICMYIIQTNFLFNPFMADRGRIDPVITGLKKKRFSMHASHMGVILNNHIQLDLYVILIYY